MKKAKMETPYKCWFWHRWRLIKDTGANRYHECKDCGSRFVRSADGASYQPIDVDWFCGAKAESPKDG